MDFGLSFEISVGIDDEKKDAFFSLSDKMKAFFKDKIYGTGIESIVVGVICVHPNFDAFYKKLPPKFSRTKKVENQLGEPVQLNNHLALYIKLGFDKVRKSGNDEIKRMATKAIIEEFDEIKKGKRYKNFDIEKFYAALVSF